MIVKRGRREVNIYSKHTISVWSISFTTISGRNTELTWLIREQTCLCSNVNDDCCKMPRFISFENSGCDMNSKPIIYTHYNQVIAGAVACQITSLTIVYSTVCLSADQRKHYSSASVAFAGNSPVTGEFSAQTASYAESVFIWWYHHETVYVWW